jgi:hypothetical protein
MRKNFVKNFFLDNINQFLSHLFISSILFITRVLITFTLGDSYKFNETLLFFSLYFLLQLISFNLNSLLTFSGLKGSFTTYIVTNGVLSIFEFIIFKLLFLFFDMQFLRIILISPVSLILRFYINKKYNFKPSAF